MTGKVYLVGAGPGDPRLITIKGLELLRSQDVVMYDELENPEMLKECRPDAELIDAGKRARDHHLSQWQTNQMLVEKAAEGKIVVRLKGGDPFLFGRGAEEAEELRKAGAEVHVVPGVSSSISVPELAGIPVTHRDYASLVTFITGHEKADRETDRIDWRSLVSGHGTLVIMMGLGNAKHISEELIAGGMSADMPAAIISKGSTPDQKVVVTKVSELASSIADNSIEPPGIIVVGEVAKMRDILGDMA